MGGLVSAPGALSSLDEGDVLERDEALVLRDLQLLGADPVRDVRQQEPGQEAQPCDDGLTGRVGDRVHHVADLDREGIVDAARCGGVEAEFRLGALEFDRVDRDLAKTLGGAEQNRTGRVRVDSHVFSFSCRIRILYYYGTYLQKKQSNVH